MSLISLTAAVGHPGFVDDPRDFKNFGGRVSVTVEN
jgi:hypothetical protein